MREKSVARSLIHELLARSLKKQEKRDVKYRILSENVYSIVLY